MATGGVLWLQELGVRNGWTMMGAASVNGMGLVKDGAFGGFAG